MLTTVLFHTFCYLLYHCIKICNFDQSTKIRKNTNSDEILNNVLSRKTILCNDEGKCNKYNQKDIFIILSSLITCAFDQESGTINNRMYEIILLITNNNYGLISAIIKNNNKISDLESSKGFDPGNDTIFSSFCKYNLENLLKTGDIEFNEHECSDANISDLDIDKILERYIEKYNSELGLIETV